MQRILILFVLLLAPILAAAAEIDAPHAAQRDLPQANGGARLTLSGRIEVEAAHEKLRQSDGHSASANALTLATLQFGVTAGLTEEFTGNLQLLFEEDVTTFGVEEATIDYAHGPWFARGGRQALPFGNFRSHLISDPLTLQLGETRQTALVAGYQREDGSGSLFLCDGNNGGASLRLTPVAGIELGASYLAELSASNAELLGPHSRRQVGGASAFAVLTAGQIELTGEVLGATRPFSAADLDLDNDTNGDKPLTWNIEVAWALRDGVEMALRYEGSREFADQPQRQYGVGGSWSPAEHVTLALEYLRGTFVHDAVSDRRNLVTAQLAVAF